MGTDDKNSKFLNFVDTRTNKEKKVDWNSKKSIWLEKVDELYRDIESWLSPLISQEKIKIDKKETVEITEDYIGTYQAPKLKIHIGSANVELIPVGTLIIASRGRINVVGSAGEIMLILTQKGFRPGVTTKVFTSKEEADADRKKTQEEARNRKEPTANELEWLYARRTHKLEYFPLDQELFEEILMAVSGS